MAALMREKLYRVLRHLFFRLSWRKFAVLRSNVGIVREMEAGTEYSTGALSNVP
jgi:hypothetical protein